MISAAADIRPYPLQITIRPKYKSQVAALWAEIQTLVTASGADGLKVVGPRAFGYEMDYVPLHRRETA